MTSGREEVGVVLNVRQARVVTRQEGRGRKEIGWGRNDDMDLDCARAR